MLTHIFINDGMPGGRDCINNYISYDCEDLSSMLDARSLIMESARARSLILPTHLKSLERAISQKERSLERAAQSRSSLVTRIATLGAALTQMLHL